MLRILFTLPVFVILLAVNIVLFVPRLLWKILVNHKAGLWISMGNNKRIIETTGNVKIR